MDCNNDLEMFETWQKIFALSSGNTWVKIPDNYCRICGLPTRMGIIGGVLCTAISARGLQQTIDKLNRAAMGIA